MTFDELRNFIEADSNIDKHKLDDESLNIASLHAKYYGLLIGELRVHRKIEEDYYVVLRERTDYYLGKAPDSAYREEPLHHKILKADVDTYINSDQKIQKLRGMLSDQKLKVECIESMLKTIGNRSFQISNAISFIKIKNGQS